LGALSRFHVAEDAAMTIATHEEVVQIPFGRVTVDGNRLVQYEEKPRARVRVSSGIYALSRRAIDMIEPDRRLDVPALVGMLLAASAPVRAWAHCADWIDVNDDVALARAEDVVRTTATRWPWSGVAAAQGS
jgi:NDP-sugar pyrophosphorylase family protein